MARRPGRPGLSPGPEPPRLAAAAIRSALHFYNLFGRKLDVGLFDTAMAQAVTGASSYATDEVDLFHHPRSSSHSSVIACAFAIASLRCVQEGDESGTWQNFTAATMYVDQALDSGERPNQVLGRATLGSSYSSATCCRRAPWRSTSSRLSSLLIRQAGARPGETMLLGASRIVCVSSFPRCAPKCFTRPLAFTSSISS